MILDIVTSSKLPCDLILAPKPPYAKILFHGIPIPIFTTPKH